MIGGPISGCVVPDATRNWSSVISLNKLEGAAVKGGGVHVLREGGSTIGSDELTSVMEGALVEAENERKGA